MSGSITNSDSTTSGTRDPSQTPFASDSVFNLPLGSDAQWQSNSQLSNADVFVNTTETGYNENIYTGTSSDPLVTVSSSGAAGGSPETYQVHIPSGAVAASGNDATFTVDDTTTGTWYSFGGFQWTGSDTATAAQASAEPDTGSGITQDGSDFDEGVGTLRESDLQAGTIDHMLRIEIPTTMAEAVGSSATDLASYAWPQTQEDGFAVNGDGGPTYSGTIPYGVTIGIPQGTPEPADVAANAGANMLWQALQDHGAMVRDTTGSSGNNVTLQADQDVNPNDPLILGMDQYGSQIMAAAEILTKQGPGSVNGGGTPVVPLDPPVSDASGTSDTTSQQTATSASSGSTSTTTTDTSGATDPSSTSASNPGGTSSATVPVTSQTVSGGQTDTGSSSGMSFISGSTTDDTTSGTSASSVGTGSTDNTTSASSYGVGTSDFTTPTSSGAAWDGGSGNGQGSWWVTQHNAPVNVAWHQG